MAGGAGIGKEKRDTFAELMRIAVIRMSSGDMCLSFEAEWEIRRERKESGGEGE